MLNEPFCGFCCEFHDEENCKHYYRPQTYWEPEERSIMCPTCGEEIGFISDYSLDDLKDVLKEHVGRIDEDYEYVQEYVEDNS